MKYKEKFRWKMYNGNPNEKRYSQRTMLCFWRIKWKCRNLTWFSTLTNNNTLDFALWLLNVSHACPLLPWAYCCALAIVKNVGLKKENLDIKRKICICPSAKSTQMHTCGYPYFEKWSLRFTTSVSVLFWLSSYVRSLNSLGLIFCFTLNL